MAVMQGLKPRKGRTPPRSAARQHASPAAGDASLFDDLGSSFLRAAGADRCDIRLPSHWRDIVARWMGVGAGNTPGQVDGAGTIAVSS